MYVTRSYEDIGKHIGTTVLNHMIVMQQLYSNASGHAERSMHYIRERQRNTDTMQGNEMISEKGVQYGVTRAHGVSVCVHACALMCDVASSLCECSLSHSLPQAKLMLFTIHANTLTADKWSER